MRQYILTMICVSLLCGIAQRLVSQKDSKGEALQILCGVIVLLTLIHPLRNIQPIDWSSFSSIVKEDAEKYVLEGFLAADQERANSIRTRTEAYILEKAASYNADLDVDVQISEDGNLRPTGVTLRGAISPYGKSMMEQYIQTQLGISRECQTWI